VIGSPWRRVWSSGLGIESPDPHRRRLHRQVEAPRCLALPLRGFRGVIVDLPMETPRDHSAMSLPGTHGARPTLEVVSLSSSSGMLNKFAAPLFRAQPVRSPVLPQSARAACSAFSPDVDADVCRWGDGLHSWIRLLTKPISAMFPSPVHKRTPSTEGEPIEKRASCGRFKRGPEGPLLILCQGVDVIARP